MKPYYDHGGITIYHGDSRDILPCLSGIDAVVTDPPYGLRFMGKAWDYDVPGVDLWRLVLAACKPGAHLLSFAGTRTQHRMAVNIEDAGFEIRDMIAWVYGSGFPKSLDVSKAIDKAAGADREVVGESYSRGMRGCSDRNKAQGARPYENGTPNQVDYVPITAPATDAAKKWKGWGTALKPSMEMISVCRKPLIGTVAENVLAHGTGALNIDGCRIAADGEIIEQSGDKVDLRRGSCAEGYDRPNATMFRTGKPKERGGPSMPLGRWPANLIHSGEDEVVGMFPVTTSGKETWPRGTRPGGFGNVGADKGSDAPNGPQYGDSGSAARFFYAAKASRSERGEGNNHPTVKPLALMRYLLKLVTPGGGLVLDPFMGSGTTLKAAQDLGLRAIGIELEEKYCEIAAKRMEQECLFTEKPADPVVEEKEMFDDANLGGKEGR